MGHLVDRRLFLLGIAALPATLTASPGAAQARLVWSVDEAFDALLNDTARVVDVRTRDEWRETGVGAGIWPVSLHEPKFAERLFRARELAEGRQIGLICATGGRSGSVMRSLQKAGYDKGFADISEGMLGSGSGPGWIAAGLPVTPMDSALASLPKELA